MDVLKIIASVAPTVATALGGPLAGIAASIAGRILMGNDKATAEEVTNYVASNQSPELLGRLREIELETLKTLKAHEIDLERLAGADRASARAREVEVKDGVPKFLGFLIIGGFLAAGYFVLAGQVEGLKDPITAALVGSVIGYLSAKADQVVAYYFGSSAGSARKTEQMHQMLSTGPRGP